MARRRGVAGGGVILPGSGDSNAPAVGQNDLPANAGSKSAGRNAARHAADQIVAIPPAGLKAVVVHMCDKYNKRHAVRIGADPGDAGD